MSSDIQQTVSFTNRGKPRLSSRAMSLRRADMVVKQPTFLNLAAKSFTKSTDTKTLLKLDRSKFRRIKKIYKISLFIKKKAFQVEL